MQVPVGCLFYVQCVHANPSLLIYTPPTRILDSRRVVFPSSIFPAPASPAPQPCLTEDLHMAVQMLGSSSDFAVKSCLSVPTSFLDGLKLLYWVSCLYGYPALAFIYPFHKLFGSLGALRKGFLEVAWKPNVGLQNCLPLKAPSFSPSLGAELGHPKPGTRARQ